MAIALSAPRATELKPRIVVVEGGGGNAVNNMIDAGLEGVEFVVANTDAQQLAFAKTDRRGSAGVTVTQPGGGPPRGRHERAGPSPRSASTTPWTGPTWCSSPPASAAAPGTGAAPIIAKAARGARHPDRRRRDQALPLRGAAPHAPRDSGVSQAAALRRHLIVIPNQNLFQGRQ
jgi:cell division protein FtsZ